MYNGLSKFIVSNQKKESISIQRVIKHHNYISIQFVKTDCLENLFYEGFSTVCAFMLLHMQ